MPVLAIGLIGGFLAEGVGLSFGLGMAVFGSLAQLLLAKPAKPPTFKSMTSAWGDTWPIVYNYFRVAGKIIQCGPVHKHDDKGKKGGPTYSQTFALGVCEGPRSIGRIWADQQVIYDPRPIVDPSAWQADTVYGVGDVVLPVANSRWQLTATVNGTSGSSTPTFVLSADSPTYDNGIVWIASAYVRRKKVGQQFNFTMRVYTGTEDQMPDSALEEIVGTGKQPGYRGLVYIVFEDHNISKYGNRIPNIDVEILSGGSSASVVTEEIELPNQYQDSANTADGNVWYYDQVTGDISMRDRINGSVVRSGAWPSGALFRPFPSGPLISSDWENHYIFNEDEVPGTIGAGHTQTLNINRVSYSTLLLADTISKSVTDTGPFGWGWGTTVIASKSGRFIAVLAENLDALTNNYHVFIYDYTFATWTADLNPAGASINDQQSMVWDGADSLWIVDSNTSGSIKLWNYETNGTLNYSTTWTPSNPGTFFDETGYIWYIEDTDQLLVVSRNGALSPAEMMAGCVNGFVMSATSHSLTEVSIGGPDWVQDFNFKWNTPPTPMNSGWTDDHNFCFTGFDVTKNTGVILVFNTDTKSSTAYDLSTWVAQIPFIDQENSDVAMVVFCQYNPTTSSFIGQEANINFLNSFVILGGTGPRSFSLGDIVRDMSSRVGLDVGQVDATALDSVIPRGCAMLSRDTARSFLEAMQPAFFYDLTDIGAEVVGTLRSNGTILEVISESDLAASTSVSTVVDRIASQRGDDLEIPKDMAVSYYDFDHDYQMGSQPAKRNQVTQYSSGRNTITLPVVMNAGEAANAAERGLYLLWIERNTRKFSVPLSYVRRTPADVVALVKDGKQYAIRITKMNLQPTLVIEGEGVSEDLGAYSLQVPMAVASIATGSFTPGTINPVVTPVLVLIDTAMLRPQDLSPGIYLAGCASEPGGGWDGETAQEAQDGPTGTFTNQATLSVQATIGTMVDQMGDFSRWTVFDDVHTVRVTLLNGSLGSDSRDNLINNFTNLVWTSNGEIWQFQTATFIESTDDGDTYALSGLLRGRFGTEQFVSNHAIGETFVLLVQNGMQVVEYAPSEIGATRYWKGVNDAATAPETAVQTVTMTTRRLMPFAPYFLRGSRDMSGNLTITGLRRMRWRGAPLWSPQETDPPVTMQIDILSGSVVVRTLTSTISGGGSGITDAAAFTAAYSAADQTTDFGSPQALVTIAAYEINAVIGRGYPGSKTL